MLFPFSFPINNIFLDEELQEKSVCANFAHTAKDGKNYKTNAEIIYERVDSKKHLVGMTNFKGNYPTKDDVKIAKNFLSEKELQVLNLLVSQFLDFAELQALEENPMTMKDWIKELDNHLLGNKRPLLDNKGKISHKQAIEKAEKEFDIYRKQEMKNLVSDFDKAIKKIKNKN